MGSMGKKFAKQPVFVNHRPPSLLLAPTRLASACRCCSFSGTGSSESISGCGSRFREVYDYGRLSDTLH